MPVRFLDPRSEPGLPIDDYALEADLSGPVTIALLANGFQDSVAFLDQVERALVAALPQARFVRHAKPNPSVAVSEEVVGHIVAECQAVVGAYGH
jgi:hypothetical protein